MSHPGAREQERKSMLCVFRGCRKYAENIRMVVFLSVGFETTTYRQDGSPNERREKMDWIITLYWWQAQNHASGV